VTQEASWSLPSPEKVRGWTQSAATLPSLKDEAGQLEKLADDYARGVGQSEDAVVVAFVGASGAGKSTLLNALVGQTLAQEGTQRPTSTQPVVYAPEDAVVGSLLGPGIRAARYRVDASAPWSGQVFVDTPDLNSVATEHRERARAVLEQADVAVVVMHKGAVVEATQAEFLADFARRRRLLFVLNFADELTPGSREALKTQAARVAASVLKIAPDEVQVFAISALEAKQGRDPSGEWPRLLNVLKGLQSEASREKIRRSNAVGILRELAERVTPALSVLTAVQADVDKALDRGFEAARAAFSQDFKMRLASSRAHLASEVRKRASSYWWGPSAGWMRLSSLGAGGLGAAALVGRQNLPVGLAVAAVSTAIDKLKEHTLASSADRQVVSAESPALLQAVRSAVTSARTAAHHEGVDTERISLPAVEELLTALQALRESAWAFTERDAVEQAVSRWWKWARFILLPVVNLPLLVLVGHVAYNVIRAYWEGKYLGFEYFLNAGALAVILSVGGAWLGSLSLARTVSRATSLAVERFDTGLAMFIEQTRLQTRKAFEDWRAPSEQLVRVVAPFDG